MVSLLHFLVSSLAFVLSLHGWTCAAFVPGLSSSRAPSGRKFATATKTFQSSSPDAISRGDAKGAALWVDNVAVSRGPSQILNEVNWRVEPRDKWAIVGANGAGKSTLLKAIMGEILYDGDITVGTKQQIGYLQQTAVSGSNKTVYEEAAAARTSVEQARQALERAQEKVAANGDAPSEADLQALDRATQRYEAAGGYQQEQEVATVLNGLGFHNLTKRCDELSGGWQMRVALAKLLLSKPTLCVMDEPGNHLDAAARKWLAQYLSRYEDGAMILVTHDVQLLSSMDHIAEISAGTLQVYKSCTYPQYLEEKKRRSQAARAEFERNQAKAAKLQGFVDRFGASATKASAAQSRVKQLEKMERDGALDAPPEAVLQKRFKPTLILPDPPRLIGEKILSLRNAQVGYSAPLVSDVNLNIVRGMKLLIRGPNGAGKSTLLHSLRGTLPLLAGERIENDYLRLGVFTQDLAQELDASSRAVDLVTAHAREGRHGDITISDQAARSVMGRLGLTGEKALRTISALSGGEKARVALAMFALKPSNLYLLDEVSNHLDVECVEALGKALSEWGEEDGAVVVVSHDRAFCDRVGFTHVATVKDGRLAVEQRDARESDWDVAVLESFEQESDDKKPSNGSVDGKLRKQAYNAPKRIAKLEAMIEEAEEKISALDEEMILHGSDVGKLMDLTKEKEAHEARVAEMMDEWEELEALLAQVA